MEKKLAQEKLAIMFKKNHYQKNTVWLSTCSANIIKGQGCL
jgi:hypothetical protein